MAGDSTISDQAFDQRLAQACEQLGIELTAYRLDQLRAYWQLFIKWNKAYNLSAIRDEESILYKHIVDSLSVVPLFAEANIARCIDVGTGGGLPGIPLAICFPDCAFTLLDSAGKKMRFLFQVKQALKLDNVTLENRRVESLKPQQPFDVVISRAFASIKNFTDITAHLLDESGEFWAMKGLMPHQELSEMEKHYIVSRHHSLQVPGVDGERCLIKLNKAGAERELG